MRVGLGSRLEQVERVLSLAARTGDLEPRRDAMARLHTLKGEARLLGLRELAGLVHELENSVCSASALTSCSAALQALRDAVNEAEAALPASALADECGPRALEEMLRELARHAHAEAERAGKRVEIEVCAPAVELSRERLDGLRAALLHLLDNAVDHGLERPDERGEKTQTGRISLRAELVDRKLRVLCEDDGRGIDLDALHLVAAERGLVAFDSARGLSPEALRSLLFEPGLSTARVLTATSGRGVGLDGARRILRELGGDLWLESELAGGTRFALYLPITPLPEYGFSPA